MLETWIKLSCMNFAQLTVFNVNQSTYSLPFLLSELEELDNHIFLNKKVVYPVENISFEYDTSNDIIIRDEIGNDIGVLLFLKNRTFEVSLISEYQFVSVLIDVDIEMTLFITSYTFNSNYVVIDELYFLDYEYKLKTTAPIWGKFNHYYPGILISPASTKVVSTIDAIELRGFNLPFYFESSIRGLQQFSPIERFLKFYHLLELNFDLDVIRRIKGMNIETESHKIGKLLREFEPKEFARLVYLFDSYCTNIRPIVDKLNLVSSFTIISKEMFFTFGKKDSNPFVEDYDKYLKFTTSGGLFSIINYKAIINKSANSEDYRKFMGKLAMYIIYRIRNSIAHNKIGEFVLTSKDQDFISDLGEPLLIEVLKQVFKN